MGWYDKKHTSDLQEFLLSFTVDYSYCNVLSRDESKRNKAASHLCDVNAKKFEQLLSLLILQILFKVKAKVKLYLSAIKHSVLKAQGGMEVYIHVLLTATLDGGEWSASYPGRFTLGGGGRGPSNH
jgi:hypothetical protein